MNYEEPVSTDTTNALPNSADVQPPEIPALNVMSFEIERNFEMLFILAELQQLDQYCEGVLQRYDVMQKTLASMKENSSRTIKRFPKKLTDPSEVKVSRSSEKC